LKVTVVGSGAAGQVVCTHLARSPDLEILKVADLDLKKAKDYAAWLNSEKVSVHKINASHEEAVAKLARGTDLLVNALEPCFNLTLMKAAFRVKANYQDLAFGPPYETLAKELKQSNKWKKAGLTAITATGNSPGITNIVASKCADELDSVEGIRIVLFSQLNSTELIATWSPATMIQDMMGEPVVYENGKFRTVPPFSGEEVYVFPDPIGPRKVSYHAHEEPHTLPRFIKKGVGYVGFKYGVNPLMEDLMRIGLLSSKPIKVKGAKVAPVDVVIACYPKPLGTHELQAKIEAGIVKGSMGCDAIEVWGKKDGKSIRQTRFVKWPSILDIAKDMPHATPTSYLAGTGAAILTKAIARHRVETRGVIVPECLEPEVREAFLAELPRRRLVLEATDQTDN
jgi:saccharopine dehydrogenase (NAD+, L-lysine-forming)